MSYSAFSEVELELTQIRTSEIISTNDIKTDFPELATGPTAVKDVAGFLAVPLSFNSREQIVFFRKGQDQVVNWAGNPFPGPSEESLEPRTSFKVRLFSAPRCGAD